MAELTDARAPLDASETARLTDFARACKAAARAVLLYPPAHPAIAATLGDARLPERAEKALHSPKALESRSATAIALKTKSKAARLPQKRP